ncbi:putative disulfide isomerase [Candidatus Fokinia solitaria]|uniref:Putative disulfide isomerase n=1 Tax=Candidatus Fokinia solitaria TaxID=1802984 RepID=A0A2U8BT34_9RICK|nr:thioredoxin domain-containing protein [Candidatus Fokinia solitaria]AWD33509.1 putative disulfide isomerase [Candidatus Fokinia solitaria]
MLFSRDLHCFLTFIFCLICLLFPYSNTYSVVNAPVKDNAIVTDSPLLSKMHDDYYIGNLKAKNVMIEYSSLTCPHCAHYHASLFTQILEKYVKTGKMLYIYRPFPLDAQSLDAAALSLCIGHDDYDLYFRVIDVLYKNQLSWLFGDYKKKMISILEFNNISKSKIEHCKSSDLFKRRVIKQSFQGKQDLKIEYTPYLILNGAPLKSELSLEMIDKKLIK